MGRKSVPTFGSKAKLKRLSRLFRDPWLFKIAANRSGRFTLQLILPPLQRPLIQFYDLIAFTLARFKAAVIDQLWQRHAGLLSDDLDRFGKSHALDLHHKVENRSALLTPEAIENVFRWIDRKRRLRLFVKRTTGHPIRASLLQRNIILHDANNVRLAAQIIDEGLRKTHKLNLILLLRF